MGDENGHQTVFRGQEGSIVTVKLIPASYRNTITALNFTAFRLQYDTDAMGSMTGTYSYMSRTVPNRLMFSLMMTSDAVQLETNIAPKQTWLDVWAITGGLFSAIGATVIMFMNFFEYGFWFCGYYRKGKGTAAKARKSSKKKKG